MKPVEYFFSFFMGHEVEACGEIIYNSFLAIENEDLVLEEDNPIMREESMLCHLNEGPAFSFLVNNCVAFERLEKIILLFLINRDKPNLYKLIKFFCYKKYAPDISSPRLKPLTF